MSGYVLDTSAIFTLIEDEPGAEKVHSLLMNALSGSDTVLISTITAIEVFYVSFQEQGEQIARERLRLIDELPLAQVPVDAKLTRIIGGLKARNRMSLADCCVAGLAIDKKATLVHKDPEFEQVSAEVNQLQLPYKQA